MRLVVETGEGIPDANSYVDFTDVENYAPSAVLAEWDALSEDEKTDRVIIASLFIDVSFTWSGRRKTFIQGLSWPRVNVFFQGHPVPDACIPAQIKRACVMAVMLVMEFGVGVFQETGETPVKKETLGPIETEYFGSLKALYESQYSDINNTLRGFFTKPGGIMTAEVVRK
jgi:hypothetical protein